MYASSGDGSVMRQKETQNEVELAPDKNKTGTVPLRIEPNTERTMGKQEVFAIIPVRYSFREGGVQLITNYLTQMSYLV